MKKINALIFSLLACIAARTVFADPDRAQLAVWANEAIIATYTYDYKNYVQQQKEIAKYFTTDGWISYTKALNDSKLPAAVQQNLYHVTSVATQPPKLITLDATHWQAIMPILVMYENPEYQQTQNLKVVISFTAAANGQGVRGFSITSLQSTVTTPPCQCKIEKEEKKPSDSNASNPTQ
ncbi:DotI/IcmL family type IV secretion protein [Legionella waltersii]|uniref:IcmL-like protein n=1 Tax=Legionella waltersii TaxID=66969 RepID=A0A0W1A5M1_9GAMM|nr:DotI/IcmL family type IV secretion protein [Legionella waltersii]KTD76629.1 IcmL-like protein [Legionella waltersii]SNU94691.1 protein IcmL-like protein [Legionella waltersii]